MTQSVGGTPISGVNVHVYPSPFKHESRILKITKTLIDAGVFEQVLICAKWDEGLADSEAIDDKRRVQRIRTSRTASASALAEVLRLAEWSRRSYAYLKHIDINCINCHSLPVLPLCVWLKLAKGAKLVYDTHELETESVVCTGLRKRLSKILERFLIRFVDETVVVGEAIADWYRREYGLQMVSVVRNVPQMAASDPDKSSILRREFGIGDDEILFIYVGAITHGRGIELLLEAFSRVSSDRHIVFMGDGELVADVEGFVAKHANIHHRAAVRPDEVVEYTSSADVGLSVIENVCLSYYLCLPNKLFEYLASGIPVIASDFPEMAKVIDGCGCGWKTWVDSDSILALVQSLDRECVDRQTQNALAARSSLGWHAEEPKLLAVYSRLFGTPRMASK